MEQEVLKRVQPVLLNMLKDIRRVCDENGIRYFLYRGTFLGAVRHKGFIPWDDDMDIAMLRQDYERFCRIAPEKLSSSYCFQNWHTDENYAHPFGKVRKRGTVYVEAKCCRLQENGFYIDIYPIDFAPETVEQQRMLNRKLLHLYRIKLMKCHYTPWKEEERTIWKKRIGYMLYQIAALFVSQAWLVEKYEQIVMSIPESSCVYEQSALPHVPFFKREWCENLAEYTFDDVAFLGPEDYDSFLSSLYGNYFELPPEDQRENRHQIIELSFGD
ncbi:MAG: LicD family protein [Oscillospiraceae bacterium]|nr:LicD family protein [Oscillospiraceae bacterium]